MILYDCEFNIRNSVADTGFRRRGGAAQAPQIRALIILANFLQKLRKNKKWTAIGYHFIVL